MTARTLMVQGVSSSAGKSLLVAAVCRIFARQGLAVAPFKAQNMSNNAAVCHDGSEIGRSQALQAAGAGSEPTADMNPILLKPEADSRSQIIVDGRRWKTLPARHYFALREQLWPHVTGALDRLRSQHELVVIEGAGSPAELNLRSHEIVNMSVARYAGAPVLLVGDIERGGIFAQLLGTLWLLEPKERELVRGLIVNKFRGDPNLFTEGVQELEQRGGVPVLGVVPWLDALELPEEDGATLRASPAPAPANNRLDVAVIRVPRIANFDDFDPLLSEPRVSLRYVDCAAQLGQPHVIILPGTKSTVDDLLWLRQSGLAEQVKIHAARGAAVVGICGGYQMLGRQIRDPHEVESTVQQIDGLGLLPTTTVFASCKQTHRVHATVDLDWHCASCRGLTVEGYEIHMASTEGGRPWLQIDSRGEKQVAVRDGAITPDGRIWGCYLHGLFANDRFRRAWLSGLGGESGYRTKSPRVGAARTECPARCWSTMLDESLDRLADAVEAAIPPGRLEAIAWQTTCRR